MSNDTHKEPVGIITIPRIDNERVFSFNERRAARLKVPSCPVCGKAILKPIYYINSIYGGSVYPANGPATETIKDAWVMAIGSECRKKLPKGYVYR